MPLVALTAGPEQPRRLAAFEAGADHALSLPLLAEELLARINALLRRSYAMFTPFGAPLRLGAWRSTWRSNWHGSTASAWR